MAAAGFETTKSQAVSPLGPKALARTIGIADIAVVRSPERLRTVLGSCVGVAIYDRAIRLGGMAHVILPESTLGSGDPGKFADTAVDALVHRLIAEGAERLRLTAKIAGGASMFGEENPDALGTRNVQAVLARLGTHTIRLAGSAVGGRKGRKMLLDPSTGEVQVETIGEAPQSI